MGRTAQSAGLVGLFFLVMLTHAGPALAQPTGPHPWWPTQRTPLPPVYSPFTDDIVLLCDNAEEEVKASNDPQIRSFTVGFYPSLIPMKLPPPARWEVRSPEFAKNFRGVGYFFAREIRRTQRNPIGNLDNTAGLPAITFRADE